MQAALHGVGRAACTWVWFTAGRTKGMRAAAPALGNNCHTGQPAHTHGLRRGGTGVPLPSSESSTIPKLRLSVRAHGPGLSAAPMPLGVQWPGPREHGQGPLPRTCCHALRKARDGEGQAAAARRGGEAGLRGCAGVEVGG